ncbi:MAG: extracellular solute-binding protein [Christensenellaceae bacterium]
MRKFNQAQSKYYVEIQDLYTPTKSFNGAVTNLNTLLISGGGPDIISFGGVSPNAYGSRGYLQDIYPLLSNDTVLSKEELLGIEAMESDGKLFSIFPGFSLNSYGGASSVFETRTAWSFTEYLKMAEGRPEANPMVHNITREIFLKESLRSYFQDTVNWKNGTCNLDNDAFITILETAASIEDSPTHLDEEYLGVTDGERIAAGINVLIPLSLNSVLDLARLETDAGQRLAIVGWPSIDDRNTSVLSPMCTLGISSQAENPDGAWQFIRYLLSDEEVQSEISNNFFPIRKDIFDGQNEVLLHPFAEFEGQKIIIENGGFWANGVFYDINYDTTPLVTEAQVKRVLDLINTTVITANDFDSAVEAIVMEEASYLFQGVKSAKECARLIQSRAALYVAEQSG